MTGAAAAFALGVFLVALSLLDATVASADEPSIGDTPIPLAIDWVSDCTGVRTAPACGAPEAQWVEADRPVPICTRQAGRPAWISAEEFRAYTAEAVLAWARVEARIGLLYTGDCEGDGTWSTSNALNEVGWDDARDLVRGTAIGVTLSDLQWPRNGLQIPLTRTIRRADVILGDELRLTDTKCYTTVLAHELGHLLGLGHSDDRTDLMYASLQQCSHVPSPESHAKLVSVYGADRRPGAASVTGVTATRGVPVTVTAAAVDPEGGAVTYLWKQTGGAPVTFSGATQAVLTVDVPTTGSVEFTVWAFDRYRHISDPVRVTLPGTSAPATSTTTTTASLSSPLPSSGFGLVIFSGGTSAQLAAAAGCASPVFWATEAGSFVTFVPGTAIGAVNAAWNAKFAQGVPANTALVARCA